MTTISSIETARRFRIRRKDGHIFQPANPRPQRRDCQGRLLAALEEMAAPGCKIERAAMRPWCSATFVGAQHQILLRLSGTDTAQRAEVLTARLREAEFSLPGHIVADLALDEICAAAQGDMLVSLAVLTIEDW